MTANWISVGIAYSNPDDGTRRLVSRVTLSSNGQPLSGCGGLADCVITYQDADGMGECEALLFDAWRGGTSAQAWGAA